MSMKNIEKVNATSVLLRIEEERNIQVFTSGVDSNGSPIIYLFFNADAETIVLSEYNGYHVFAVSHDGDYINVALIKE